jgi:hypothetical protein
MSEEQLKALLETVKADAGLQERMLMPWWRLPRLLAS